MRFSLEQLKQWASEGHAFSRNVVLDLVDQLEGKIKVMEQATKSRFTFHIPDADGIQKMRAIRRHVRSLVEAIEMLCPDSRERSHALTQLQTVMMHANSAIVQQYPLDDNDV